ncbi:membrane bound O-acyl transferase family-domain-containing protein [Aspergillus venezuelensis]
MVDFDSAFVRYERLVLDANARIDSLIQNGDAKPLLLCHALIPMILPICALLIPSRRGGWVFRQILYVFTVSLSVEIIRYRRARLGANGYMVGLMMVWWIIWVSTLLVFHNVERKFRRIERVPDIKTQDAARQQNGHTSNKQKAAGSLKNGETLIWRSYPQTIGHRLGWTVALFLNMRGPDFSFRLSSLDPLPAHLDAKRQPEDEKPICPQATTRIWTAIKRFVFAYLVIDVLKTILIWDPYFFGDLSAEPPSPLDQLSFAPGAIRFYRTLVSGTGVYFALLFVTALNPIFFLGLSTAFPNACRKITATPFDAPWLYADQFGSFSVILDEGLAGAWGKWWHQIFRFGFVSTAKWIISFLPQSISSKRSVRRSIMTFVAFGISGLIHGTGSYTQIGDTHPISGPFAFFALQAVGVLIQETWNRTVLGWLDSSGVPLPRWLRRLSNLLFVLVWLSFSGRRIADDFALGGLWLTEPLPFSPIRGLMGRGWNSWTSPWFEYVDDGTYWGRGVRVI